MVTSVHVIFKTHLDLGFTDTASNVTNRYVHEYLPRAIALAEELERRGGEARFIWTTGSWMIHEALRLGTPDERLNLEAAIRKGQVRWHGLPMTTHTELMDAGLLEHALSIGRGLDAQFGMHTMAAKMTDVPGHTIGLVPFLQRGGIDYLHLGVNGASAVPEVPEFFVWRAPDGSEVVVNYAQSYGATETGVAIVPGGTDALHLAHTGDNFGPPSADDVEKLFAQLAEAYPGARIFASTLDAFAGAVLTVRDELPVLEQEIGDTWIHGVASDPVLTARLGELLRLRTHWVKSGELVPGTPECDAFSDGLLLVPEHTWGQDLKTHLADYVNYEKSDFVRARAADVVDPTQNPSEFDVFAWAYSEHPKPEGLSYSTFEASWAEQRAHLDRALAALTPPRRAIAVEALAALQGSRPESEPEAWNAVDIDLADEHTVGAYRTRIGADGSLVSLIDEHGVQWAGPQHPLAAYRYQTFDERDEDRWRAEYNRDSDVQGFWSIPDFSKPGLAIAETQPATVFEPRVLSASRSDEADSTVVSVNLAVPDDASDRWGAARSIRLSYRFGHEPGPIEITLDLCDKDASRLPEASWLGFKPLVDEGDWRLTKLGTAVDPQSVVVKGNRSLHAVSAVTHAAADRSFSLSPLDAPVVAVGEPKLYRFTNDVAEPNDGFHVNLHNNVWGTNFTMWLEEDLRFRFVLELASSGSVATDVTAVDLTEENR